MAPFFADEDCILEGRLSIAWRLKDRVVKIAFSGGYSPDSSVASGLFTHWKVMNFFESWRWVLAEGV